MQVNPQEIEAVAAKLEQQNGFKAALAVSLWSAPMLVFWYWLYQVYDPFAPVMLAVSGALVGFAVRYYGRGYAASFGLIGFLAHAAVVVSAFLFGMSLGEGQSMRIVILVGLYAAGAWLAAYVGRIRIPFEQHRAYYVLTEENLHPSFLLAKNRWFFVAPVTLILSGLTLFIALFGLSVFHGFTLAEQHYTQQQEYRENFESRAIDVTPDNLATLSTDEAMRHAYAFFNGFLPAQYGNRFSTYPRSEYKAKRILSYLAEEREDPRARFVLGLLTYNDNGLLLIQQAAEEGDIYARIHTAAEFGCYGDNERANDLLTRLARTVNEKSAQNEIYSILSTGFERVCEGYKTPDFALMYIDR